LKLTNINQIKATVARSVRLGRAGRKKAARELSGEQVSLRFEE